MILKRTCCVFSINGSFRIFVSGTGVELEESLPYVCLLGHCRSYTRHAARRLIEECEVTLSHWDGHCFATNQMPQFTRWFPHSSRTPVSSLAARPFITGREFSFFFIVQTSGPREKEPNALFMRKSWKATGIKLIWKSQSWSSGINNFVPTIVHWQTYRVSGTLGINYYSSSYRAVTGRILRGNNQHGLAKYFQEKPCARSQQIEY